MVALANAGFRAIAPDYRGYGLSDPPPEPDKATFSDLLTDLLAILDALALSKGLGSFTLGVPYVPPGPPMYHKYLPEGFYILRWREPEGQRLILDVLMQRLLCGYIHPFLRKSIGEDFNLPDPVVKVPALLIMGGKDYILKFPGIEDLAKGERAKEFVPIWRLHLFLREHFSSRTISRTGDQLLLAFLAKHI
ncbi:Alpha/Beta hydrolase fold [Sesbania bispinosa]|nr:Alpha/Beta hydrolase fold [Sesbania bispinosa]